MKIPTPAEWRTMTPAEKIKKCEEVKDQYRDPRQIAAMDSQIAYYKQQERSLKA